MRTSFYFILLSAVLFIVACGKREKQETVSTEEPKDSAEVSEDTMVYGLACEGCTDSVVWLLPSDASDPITYDIVDAIRRHHILGKIRTGDGIAVVVNPKDSAVADMVIDLDQLKGTWCFEEMPLLKNAGMLSAREQRKAIAELPDSVKEMYYRPMEYGFTLKRNDIATPIGGLKSQTNTDEDNPFVYKEDTKFTAWRLLNGKLVLTRQVNERIVLEDDSLDTDGKDAPPLRIEAKKVNDTVDIVYLYEDSLAIKFKDHTQGYSRKK